MEKSNVYLLLSILLITTSSHSTFSYGQNLLPNLSVGRIVIYGVLTCSLEGDQNAPPISGESVYLYCNGLNMTIAEAVTDSNGTFAIVLEIIQTVLFSLNNMSCRVVANLPTGTCELYPPNGIITGSVMLANVAVTNTGTIIFFAVNNFTGGVL